MTHDQIRADLVRIDNADDYSDPGADEDIVCLLEHCRALLGETKRQQAELDRIRTASGAVVHTSDEECAKTCCGCMQLTAEEAVAATIGDMRDALKPFADEVKSLQPWMGCDGHDGAIEDCPLWKFTRVWHGDKGPTVGDCQRAAEVLAATEPKASV